MPNQLTANIMMVRPANFGFNPETAENNAFQENDDSLTKLEIKNKAIKEFDSFVETLRAAGVQVIVMQDTERPVKMDAVFPNNWISFHEDGLVVTYPMFSLIRRAERRQDIIDKLNETFVIQNHVKLEKWERAEQFLEGTGSIILDRGAQIAYACLSDRTNDELFDEFCEIMKYEKVVFNSVDKDGTPIYHTNVMMAMGNRFVVICMESIADEGERKKLYDIFKRTNKEIIEISLDQVYSFAGNMLQVKNQANETFLVMSSQAYRSLSQAQIEQINKFTQILHSELETIETYGGGSARCMMAEVFLPVQ